jgi:hypothetical protein
MKCPAANANRRLRWLLFPFKAWVVAVYPACQVLLISWPRHADIHGVTVLSVAVLVVSSGLCFVIGERREAGRCAAFAGAGALSWLLLLPWLVS